MDTDEPIDEIETEEIEDEATEDTEDEELEGGDEPEAEDDNEADEEDKELVVTIGDDEPDEDETSEEAPDWVKKVRADNRELKKYKKAKEAEEAERAASKEQSELGKKPNRDDYDYGKDDQYDVDLIAWNDQKKDLEAKKKDEADKNTKYEEAYQEKLAGYESRKREVSVDNFDALEDRVKEKLSVQQHSIAVHLMEKSELFVVALGNNSKELARLAEIEDPLQFAFEISKIEDKLKMTTRKKPAVFKGVKGKAKIASSDNRLDKLRAEAEKSGDMSAVIAYKREQKEKLRKAS